jgi:nitroimidazol reductase NimA-like FMN-containing flavoprotein (pyridoxamine 5'-phosphate oxidase superfamily)
MIAELGRDEIDALLRDQVVGRIGCHVDGLTYVVPIIYAYDGADVYVVSIEGQKIRMMRTNPAVCFEVDDYVRGSWRSVIGYGRYEELAGEDAELAIALLAARFAAGRPETGERPEPRGGGRPTVAFRIRLSELTGRAVRRS